MEFELDKEKAYKRLESKLGYYIPIGMIGAIPSINLTLKIFEVYILMQKDFINITNTKIQYLEAIKKSHLWESHQIQAKVSNKNILQQQMLDKITENVILGISPKGIYINGMNKVFFFIIF